MQKNVFFHKFRKTWRRLFPADLRRLPRRLRRFFTWVDISIHLNALNQKNLRNLRGNLRKSAGNKPHFNLS